MRGLQARFDTRATSEGPYFFTDLDGVTRADEQAAIDAKVISSRPDCTIRANGAHDRAWSMDSPVSIHAA